MKKSKLDYCWPSVNYQNKKLMVNGKDMIAIMQQLISPPPVPPVPPVPTIKAR
jgi:hypothetical protein